MCAPRSRLLRIAALVLVVACGFGCDLQRVLFPSAEHDRIAPELDSSILRPSVLVFSKTNGFRHEDAILAGLPFFEEIALERGWTLVATENGAVHNPEQLEEFDVVVWFQVSGDVLDDTQRASLREWIEAGGSFFGIHGTGGDPFYDWAWQPETLIGAQFVGHPFNPQFQEAEIRIERPDHPAMRHLDATWTRVDEWYSFETSPRGPEVSVLATLDESTYSPKMDFIAIDRDLAMGPDHPIIWTRCIGRGRALYSALGHLAEAYAEPAHREFLEAAIDWLIRSRATPCTIPGT